MKLPNLICLVIIFGSCNRLYAWENKKTHPAITSNGVETSVIDDYLKTQMGLTNGVATQLYWDFPSDIKTRIDRGDANPNQTTRDISEWLRVGSIIEDTEENKDPRRALAAWRPRHHFHDPTRDAGLDNHTDHPEWEAPFWSSWLPLGESALTWATIGQTSYDPRSNHDKWGTARTIFYQALTEEDSNTRRARLAESLMKLGCVLHLLEDMGVPAHTRNDFLFGHYRSAYMFDWGNPLEGWVEKQVKQNGGVCPWSGSNPVVFDKLTKYFDAEVYDGDYLGDGIVPPNTWGLAECSNYQFLSLSTIFRNDGSLYVFPHPSRENVQPNLFFQTPFGKKIYFDGSNYGVTYIARHSYTRYKASLWGHQNTVFDNTNTTNDVFVFEDYANITIPRTIDYTTGLANYFFRGKLEIEPNCLDCNIVTFVIRNDSNNSGVPQALKGGSFELLWDDRDGNRTEINDFAITGWTTGSELEYDQQVTGTFSRPDSNNIERYTVVYKGTISENPDEPDEDDLDAIAVATLKFGYPIIAWGRDNNGQVSGVPDGNDFIDVAAGTYHGLAIRSNGELVGWGSNSYGQCDVPDDNDFIAIAGGSRHSIALKSDGSIIGWGDNTLGQTDVPAGNDFVAIAAGEYHNLAITTEGLIVGWGGWNDFGQCDAPEPNVGTVYVAVSAGRYHSLALQSDGTIRAWGSNNMGQTRIYQGANDDHEVIAAAGDYNFLLRTDDMLITWGGGEWLEPGMPYYHYRQPDEHDFIAIAAGGYHIAALTIDGKILSWGYDDFDPPLYPVPQGVIFTKDVAAGWKFTIALRKQ